MQFREGADAELDAKGERQLKHQEELTVNTMVHIGAKHAVPGFQAFAELRQTTFYQGHQVRTFG